MENRKSQHIIQVQTVQVKEVVFGKGMPKVCIPIVGRTIQEIRKQSEALKNAPKDQVPFDLVEWRMDFYENSHDCESVLEALKIIKDSIPTPILTTFRTRMEGGEQWYGIEQYQKTYKIIIESGIADIIDVELELGENVIRSLCELAHKHGIKVIISNHDFYKTPDKSILLERLEKMHQLGADIPKIAVMPTCEQDVLDLMTATRQCVDQKHISPIITMSMGKLGLISRIAGELYGSSMTFATNGQPSAPGQIKAKKLQEMMKELQREQ